jgi:hypothetical protein
MSCTASLKVLVSLTIEIPSTLISALLASSPEAIAIPPAVTPSLASVETLSSSAVSLVITKSLPAPDTFDVRTSLDSVPVLMMFAVTPKFSSESLIASRKSAKVAPASSVKSKLLSPAAKHKATD